MQVKTENILVKSFLMKQVLDKSIRNTRHCELAKQSEKNNNGLLRKLPMTEIDCFVPRNDEIKSFTPV